MLFHRPLLVADHAEAFGMLRRVLPAGIPLVHAATMADAHAALRNQPCLVICGCEFDESGMYDLLRHVKAQHPDTPFLAIRCIPGEMLLDDTAYDSVKMAVTALGGDGFVDFVWWRGLHGEEEAARRLAQVVDDLVARGTS